MKVWLNSASVTMKQNITGIHCSARCCLEDLLVKDIEEYGVLKITKKGQEFLKKPRSFEIVLNNAFEEANAEDDEEGAEAGSGNRIQR